jgi:hypothetical protein
MMSGRTGNQPPRLVAHYGVNLFNHGTVPLLMLLGLGEGVWLIHNLQVKHNRYLVHGLARWCRCSEDVVNLEVTVFDAVGVGI